MGSLDDDLVCVLQRFPERKNWVDRLYLDNEDFRALCSDYTMCVREIERMVTAGTTGSEEYKMLKFSLEREILQFLDSCQGHP